MILHVVSTTTMMYTPVRSLAFINFLIYSYIHFIFSSSFLGASSTPVPCSHTAPVSSSPLLWVGGVIIGAACAEYSHTAQTACVC